MRINNNLMAMNTHRQLGITTESGAKSTEKLSSGFRINRAGDDAAGLAISEKMRGQIRGLTQASRNSQDGISLIQTAEGALNETHAILQRMRELAVQSATDTNVEADRKAIQDEMDELTAEVDRISNTTEFNTQKLLDGSFKGTFQIGANEDQNVDLQINRMNTANLGLAKTSALEEAASVALALKDGAYTVNDDGDKLEDVYGNVVGTVNEGSGKIVLSDGASGTFAKASLKSGTMISVEDGKVVGIKVKLSENAQLLAPGKYEIRGNDVVKDNRIVGDFNSGSGTITIDGLVDSAGALISLQASDLGLKLTDDKLTAGTIFTVNGSDVSTRATAEGSITSINDAIEQVSRERSKLGAMQNRLEHTIKNLDNSAENLQAAESRIRDVDMAKEMMEFTKQNILQQASTAMLAQANMAPQSVLQLLR